MSGVDVTVTINDFWLTFLVATALPMLVAVIRSRYASSKTGALILVFLSVISGWLTSLGASGGEFDLKTAVVGIFVSFITAVGTHYGLLKPAGVTGSDGAIQKALPMGVGATKAISHHREREV